MYFYMAKSLFLNSINEFMITTGDNGEGLEYRGNKAAAKVDVNKEFKQTLNLRENLSRHSLGRI
jgi:hypothetical protein